jgi:predicted metalloprotease with PDZ domain
MPIHVGQVQTFRFHAAEVPVELSVWGDACPGVFSWEQLTRDLGKIMADHVTRFAAAPFDTYTFVLMLSHDAYGGLEHRNSSINLFGHLALTSRKQYEHLLELLSHELFHAWNGKRIAPPVLLDFDYRQEAYTRSLWVVEGITSYYDRWALRSARVITGKSYLEKVLDDWTRLLAIPGRNRQSLEASSFDAWIKLYKPDESNLNTTVSYYLKGGLVMFALDLYLRRHSDGARSLDQVLQALWRDFGARGVGYPENLEEIFTAAAGVDLHEAFATWIRGTSDPDLVQELGHVGIELRRSYDSAQTADGATPAWLGITTAGCKISGVLDETPAQASGLSPGDEIVAIDGFQVSSESALRALLAARKPGDTLDVALFRRQKLTHLTPTLEVAPRNKWELVAIADPGLAARRYEAWLGEPHPSGQTITTVNAASRAL